MSKLLTNQISNYADNGPVEAKEGLNFATGKPLQIAGVSGTSGQYLKSTGSSIEWTTFPTIPSAQVNTDWNATSGVTQILNKPNLATVATTGSYTDLLNQPTIPAAQLQSDWNQSNSGSLDFIKNKPTLFDGQYASLSGAPSVPATVNDLQIIDAVTANRLMASGNILTNTSRATLNIAPSGTTPPIWFLMFLFCLFILIYINK